MTKRGLLLTLCAALAIDFGCEHGSHANHDEPAGHAHAKRHREHEHEAHEHKAGQRLVRLSPKALEHADIKLAKVEKRPIVGAIRLPAEVRADPDKVAHITPLVPSQVANVKVRPGDTVKKGQVLAILKSVELGEARASIASAQAAVEVAEDRLERQAKLVQEGIGAEKARVEAKGEFKRAKADLNAAS